METVAVLHKKLHILILTFFNNYFDVLSGRPFPMIPNLLGFLVLNLNLFHNLVLRYFFVVPQISNFNGDIPVFILAYRKAYEAVIMFIFNFNSVSFLTSILFLQALHTLYITSTSH